MSVNQTTDVPAASEYPAEAPSKPAKAAREDSRTDMVGKALGLLVLLGDEPRGASAKSGHATTRGAPESAARH